MKHNLKFYISTILFSIFTVSNALTQSFHDTVSVKSNNLKILNETLNGLILDANDKSALTYANIYIPNQGTGVISNEKGHFSIQVTSELDSLRISHIGYKSKNVSIEDMRNSSIIYLQEDRFMLNNITVFGSEPNPESIVKKVLENRTKNYLNKTSKKKLFLRERHISDVNQININPKKSYHSILNEEMLKLIETEIPKQSISYTDFLGNVYQIDLEPANYRLKIDPIKTIELEEEKDFTKLEELKTAFKDLYSNTAKDEYWKFKTGVIGGKVYLDENSITIGYGSANTDSVSKDSIYPFQQQKSTLHNILNYSLMEDEADWEFLYQPHKYEYNLYGGTEANGEDVYIIDFTPLNKGKFTGRMYISMNTYALVRADYEFNRGKTGKDIQIFGIGYTETKFKSSIYFENNEGSYALKYCSKQTGYDSSINRVFSFLKKKNRFLFDKTISQTKLDFNLGVSEDSSIELLILDEAQISLEEYTNFKEKDKLEIIFVNEFNDKLWEGYSIIEPTKQMKEYKKTKLK